MPRAGLSHAVVVEGAAELADEIGLERLTLAALAERYGVAVPSLYKHVGGSEALRRDLAIASLGGLAEALGAALDDAPPGDPRARLHAIADAYRGYAQRHPGRYAATVRAGHPGDEAHAAAAEPVLRTVLALLAERGIGGAAAIDATRALRAGLHGFVALEAAGGFGLPRDVDRSFDRLVDALDAGLIAWPARTSADDGERTRAGTVDSEAAPTSS